MIAGFYKTKSHTIVDMDRCLIQTGEADAILSGLKKELTAIGMQPYNEASHEGMLRHVVIRTARATGEVMVVLVTKKKKFPQKDAAVASILKLVPNVTSIMQNINSDKTNVIFGDETINLWGKDVIIDAIGDVRFEISARSFYQVNPQQTEVLYKQALDYADLQGHERVH
ncbi:23S rRNA (Uracil-5-)-methyltransferase RumA OS=Lysinibacillus sphaericus OX=1421 GN=LS41612_03225 PE=3 SV=1 [Lysinibacillus sphaericus]